MELDALAQKIFCFLQNNSVEFNELIEAFNSANRETLVQFFKAYFSDPQSEFAMACHADAMEPIWDNLCVCQNFWDKIRIYQIYALPESQPPYYKSLDLILGYIRYEKGLWLVTRYEENSDTNQDEYFTALQWLKAGWNINHSIQCLNLLITLCRKALIKLPVRSSVNIVNLVRFYVSPLGIDTIHLISPIQNENTANCVPVFRSVQGGLAEIASLLQIDTATFMAQPIHEAALWARLCMGMGNASSQVEHRAYLYNCAAYCLEFAFAIKRMVEESELPPKVKFPPSSCLTWDEAEREPDVFLPFLKDKQTEAQLKLSSFVSSEIKASFFAIQKGQSLAVEAEVNAKIVCMRKQS